MPAISPELKKALVDLLAVPGGAQYDAQVFRDVVWTFAGRLCNTPEGARLLDQCGYFVRRQTAVGTPYSQAWQKGHTAIAGVVYTRERKPSSAVERALEKGFFGPEKVVAEGQLGHSDGVEADSA